MRPVRPVRPVRTPAGDVFTALVVDVAQLGAMFTARGERFAHLAGQTLARWVILDAIEDAPSTVAQVARHRGIARQAVQRVADLLERDGLATYEPNPQHRRAQLLRLTPAGRDALRAITPAQVEWSDGIGASIGVEELTRTRATLEKIRGLVLDEIRRAGAPAGDEPVAVEPPGDKPVAVETVARRPSSRSGDSNDGD